MPEVWKDIPGFEGYEASDAGRIRSVDRWNHFGQYRRWLRGRILRSRVPRKSGYETIVFSHTTALVHQLVMLAFVGPPPEGMEVCHNDNDRLNNCLANLRYGTRQSNNLQKGEHGTSLQGERHHQARLTEAEVRAIKASNEGLTVLAARYNVSDGHISGIKRGRYWRHLPC